MNFEKHIRINPSDLKWFVNNYQESKEEILELLWDYIKNSPLTAHDCYIGCSHLNQINEMLNVKIRLVAHLHIISELSLVGINASDAGRHIRMALTKNITKNQAP
ncbi:MAG: hypothetical protein KAV87_39930 [Desulfobacteraceae bacterium]|nr:hypothetical protein [Desulfobacteraceae bacterium]